MRKMFSIDTDSQLSVIPDEGGMWRVEDAAGRYFYTFCTDLAGWVCSCPKFYVDDSGHHCEHLSATWDFLRKLSLKNEAKTFQRAYAS